MTLELIRRQDYLPPAPVLKTTSSFVNDEEIGKAVSFPTIPSLEEMLKQVGRLPKDSLFFGCTEDDLPVLLDLRNPHPGPILISGDAGAGKTELLQVITQFAAHRYDPCQIQYGVVTDRPDEWNDRVHFPHCVGIFSMCEEGAVRFIKALEAWTDLRKRNEESVLLLIDGLNEFARSHSELIDQMTKILVYGPTRKIRTIATYTPSQQQDAQAWLKYFQAQIFGQTNSATIESDPGLPESTIRSLASGCEFILKESGQWIRFRIPKV